MDNKACTHESICDKLVYRKSLCRLHYNESRPRAFACAHIDRPVDSKGLCHSCSVKKWMSEHPEANSGNNWSKNNPDRARKNRRRATLKQHGITPEDYEKLWVKQKGKCANPSCDNTAPLELEDYRYENGLQVDHCHKTGEIRGLLCSGCNRALGLINDSISKLYGLTEYLWDHAVKEE